MSLIICQKLTSFKSLNNKSGWPFHSPLVHGEKDHRLSRGQYTEVQVGLCPPPSITSDMNTNSKPKQSVQKSLKPKH